MKHCILFFMIIGMSAYVQAQQFSYKPVNPFFGGDTFNYQQLVTSASVQNGLTAPIPPEEQVSELEQFGEQLNQNILNAIRSQLTQAQLEGLDFTEEGTFTFGSLNIDVFETFDGLVIDILDTNNGEVTQIIVPN
jgi:curli production assembly/transport component CsgF